MVNKLLNITALVAILLAGSNSLIAGTFIDNFDVADSTVIGNGWVEVNSAVDRMDVQIVGEEISFVRTGGPSVTSSNISKDLDLVKEVSADLIFADASNSNASVANMAFAVKDATVEYLTIILRYDADTTVQKFTITYKGTDSWRQVSGSGEWHNYKVVTADNGETRVYVDGTEIWASADGGLDPIVNATISAGRDWEWVSFKADNFRAMTELPSSAIPFQDDFYRADSDDVGNGWVESGSVSDINPKIKDKRAYWSPMNAGDGSRSSSITQEYAEAGEVSVDMCLPNANLTWDTALRFEFKIYDADGKYARIILRTTDTSEQFIQVYLTGDTVYEGTVSDYTAFHNYKFRITSAGKVKVYFDHQLQWESNDGAMGLSTSAEIIAARWWQWHPFYADNFKTVVVGPTNCYEIWEEGLGMATDYNQDCRISLEDFAVLAENWMTCNIPGQAGCIETW